MLTHVLWLKDVSLKWQDDMLGGTETGRRLNKPAECGNHSQLGKLPSLSRQWVEQIRKPASQLQKRRLGQASLSVTKRSYRLMSDLILRNLKLDSKNLTCRSKQLEIQMY